MMAQSFYIYADRVVNLAKWPVAAISMLIVE